MKTNQEIIDEITRIRGRLVKVELQVLESVEPIEWPQEGDEVWWWNNSTNTSQSTKYEERDHNLVIRGHLFKTESDCIRDDQYCRATTLLKSIADRQGEAIEGAEFWYLYRAGTEWYWRGYDTYEYQGCIKFRQQASVDAIQKEFEAAGLKMEWLINVD